MVDVVVTETERPVYLVLAGPWDVLWNLHKAKGVGISRAAILGVGNAGIVNLDPGVPVTVLAGNAGAACKTTAHRRPQDYWQVVREAAKGDRTSKQAVESRMTVYAKYDRWFTSNFGKSSEGVTIGIEMMSHALVGPVPASLEARVPYHGFAGSTVRLAPADHAFFAASPS